jgi:hypothetical protein
MHAQLNLVDMVSLALQQLHQMVFIKISFQLVSITTFFTDLTIFLFNLNSKVTDS